MVRLDDACAILWTMSVTSWFTVDALSHFLLSSEKTISSNYLK